MGGFFAVDLSLRWSVDAMARSSSPRVAAALAVLALVCLFQNGTFVGGQPSAAASRVALRARGGANAEQNVVELLVTCQSTGQRIRFSVPPTKTMGQIKEEGLMWLGLDFAWAKSSWKISPENSKTPADAMAGAMDESKTVGDYGLGRGDELHVWFTPDGFTKR